MRQIAAAPRPGPVGGRLGGGAVLRSGPRAGIRGREGEPVVPRSSDSPSTGSPERAGPDPHPDRRGRPADRRGAPALCGAGPGLRGSRRGRHRRRRAAVLSPARWTWSCWTLLPDMTGLDLCRTLRGRGDAVDVIAVTSARDLPTVRAAVSLGIVQYLIKPFQFATFRSRSSETYAEYRRAASLPKPTRGAGSRTSWTGCWTACARRGPRSCRRDSRTARWPRSSGILRRLRR